MRIALRLLRSKQKHGVFFPKKRRAFVLGLDWVERINRWLYCSRPHAHSEAPPGDAFCTHIACFHIPAWGFARENVRILKNPNLPVGFHGEAYSYKMHNIKTASFTVPTIILN